MSVFDALGTAAAVLRFIEYGIEFSIKVAAIYKNWNERTELHQRISEFKTAHEAFEEDLRLRSSNPSPGEVLLTNIAQECSRAATDLTNLLDKLSPAGQEKSKRKALATAVKYELKKKDILAKQHRLQALRQQCHEQLALVMSDQQYALAKTLKRMENDQQACHSNVTRQLIQLKTEILAPKAEPNAFLTAELLRNLQKLVMTDLPQASILSSLQHPEMASRQDAISEPSLSTYNWIFETKHEPPHPVTYVPWLEIRDGIYWVTGKAGSGKSTLMKHIWNHDRTTAALERWANGRKVITASHFFWYSGSAMEKSHTGLLRSILYGILSSCPALIETTARARWSAAGRGLDVRSIPWTYKELLDCLEALVAGGIRVEDQGVCFCLFIDGLDEYDGDYEVVDAIVRLGCTKHIKICASSRPWNKFENAFATSKQQGDYLELHHHTRDDIARHAHQEMSATLANSGIAIEEWKLLLSEITERAEGVFLWATLVIKKELRPMLEARESVSSVKRQLTTIPSGLDEYFKCIFQRIWITTKYKSDTARIFKSCIAANSPLPVATLKVMVRDDPLGLVITRRAARRATMDNAQDASHHGTHKLDKEEDLRLQRRVNARCQDLISVVGGRLEFLHRSVRDFLVNSRLVSQELDHQAGHYFNAHVTLIACYTFLIKANSMALTNGSQGTPRSDSVEWCNEALEQMRAVSASPWTKSLLLELDENMRLIHGNPSNHWAVDPRFKKSENLHSDLVSHLIQLDLVAHVEVLLKDDPTSLERKKGRPYLDYALRGTYVSGWREAPPNGPLNMDRTFARGTCSFATIELLLKLGCSVNEMYEGPGYSSLSQEKQTVWQLFVDFVCHAGLTGEFYQSILWLLLEHGARFSRGPEGKDAAGYELLVQSTREQLVETFGRDEAQSMLKRVEGNESEKSEQISKCESWWVWPSLTKLLS